LIGYFLSRRERFGRLCYPRIAALAFSAAAIIASFADLAPDTTSFTPIMKTSWMGLDCGWKRDSGPGLDAKTMDRVFDAFFTTKSKGMGMGLAICQSIIETHGGRLWAGANEPRGATFQFTLPLAAGDTVPPRNAGQVPAI
jgi:phosphoglycerate-specific signal transduction histidine kinase